MYKKIMIATDTTEQSGSAVIEAINIAAKYKGEIFLLHILQMIVGMDGVGGATWSALMQKIENSAEKYMKVFKGLASADGVNKCETIVKYGVDFYSGIINEIKKHNADLLMLGRRGKINPFKRLFFGSMTDKLLKYCPCDLLIVPLASLIQWNNLLLVLINGSADDIAINKTIKLGAENKSKIHILNFDRSSSEIEIIKKRAEENGCIIEDYTFSSNDNIETIRKFEIEKNIDVIITANNNSKNFKKLIYGGLTEQIIVNSICGALIVKN